MQSVAPIKLSTPLNMMTSWTMPKSSEIFNGLLYVPPSNSPYAYIAMCLMEFLVPSSNVAGKFDVLPFVHLSRGWDYMGFLEYLNGEDVPGDIHDLGPWVLAEATQNGEQVVVVAWMSEKQIKFLIVCLWCRLEWSVHSTNAS